MSESITSLTATIGPAENRKAKSPECIFRPSQPVDGQISLLWMRGVELVELVYEPGEGIRFVIRDESGTKVSANHSKYRTLSWIEAYARSNSIRLASSAEVYGTIGEIAEQVRGFLHRYFDADPLFESVATEYVIMTWVYERFHAVPYLRFIGPSGIGKTRGTEAIGALCYRPLVIAGSVTPAPMFRLIEAMGGTVLIDEADFRDSQIGSDIIKVLNCGYQQGLPVSRMEKDEKGVFVPKLYSVFGPKIINGRERFRDDATESRCLPYTPSCTGRNDIPSQLPDEFEDEAREIRNKLLRWRLDNLDTLDVVNVRVSGLNPRLNQIISPLLIIAELIGEPRYRKDLTEFARGVDRQVREDRLDSIEAKLVEAYLAIRHTSPTCKDLADVVGEREGPKVERWLTPRKARSIMVSMGFSTEHTRRGAQLRIDEKRLAALCGRFGIVTTVTQTSHS